LDQMLYIRTQQRCFDMDFKARLFKHKEGVSLYFFKEGAGHVYLGVGPEDLDEENSPNVIVEMISDRSEANGTSAMEIRDGDSMQSFLEKALKFLER
jgi:hypothetical protein